MTVRYSALDFPTLWAYLENPVSFKAPMRQHPGLWYKLCESLGCFNDIQFQIIILIIKRINLGWSIWLKRQDINLDIPISSIET
jgi:hypothetical protein